MNEKTFIAIYTCNWIDLLLDFEKKQLKVLFLLINAIMFYVVELKRISLLILMFLLGLFERFEIWCYLHTRRV